MASQQSPAQLHAASTLPAALPQGAAGGDAGGPVSYFSGQILAVTQWVSSPGSVGHFALKKDGP